MAQDLQRGIKALAGKVRSKDGLELFEDLKYLKRTALMDLPKRKRRKQSYSFSQELIYYKTKQAGLRGLQMNFLDGFIACSSELGS